MQVNVAFNSIGFHTSLILNRLRNERLKSAIAENQEEADAAQKREEEAARAKLTFVNRRVTDLAEFERRARGENVIRRKR